MHIQSYSFICGCLGVLVCDGVIGVGVRWVWQADQMGPSQEMYLMILSLECLFSQFSFLQPAMRLKKQGTVTSTFFSCEKRHCPSENLHFPRELQTQGSLRRSWLNLHLLPWGQQFSKQSFLQVSLLGQGLTTWRLMEWEKRQLKPYLQLPMQKWMQGQQQRSTWDFPHFPAHLLTAKYCSGQKFFIVSSSVFSRSYFRNYLLYIVEYIMMIPDNNNNSRAADAHSQPQMHTHARHCCGSIAIDLLGGKIRQRSTSKVEGGRRGERGYGEGDCVSYFYIIELFYCPVANYTILTMFEINPAVQPPIRPATPLLSLPALSSGPFLIERLPHLRREPRKEPRKWAVESQLRYLAWLRAFGAELQGGSGREAWLPFQRMARFISVRNANQCRIHHKQMLALHHSSSAVLQAHSDLIRIHALSFNRYADELIGLAAEWEIGEQGKNKRSRLLKSVIIGNPKMASLEVHAEPLCSAAEDKKAEDCIPTDVAYPDEPPLMNSGGRLKGVSRQFYHSAPQFMNETHFSSSAAFPPQQSINEEKRGQWEQCHQLFLAWTTKLHSLLHS